MKNTVKGWTDARFRAFITTTLRAGFRRFPNKFEALKEAKVGKGINPKTKREVSYYQCASCLGKFMQKEVQVDHVKPVVPKTGFTTWDKFIENLFCGTKNLQVLCKPCHLAKTKKERRGRNVSSNSKKKDTKTTDSD